MLYTAAKRHLLEALKSAGLKSKPYTTQKALEKSVESHIGAVLFENEELDKDGSKRVFRDEDNTKKKRRKVFARVLTFTVIIGDYNDEAVEAMYEKFLAALGDGIYDDGNYVSIEPRAADWVNKDDSLLKAQVAVQVSIVFNGGLYLDTGFTKIADVQVADVTREKR